MKAFQAKHNLKPTGDVDVKTWLKLFRGHGRVRAARQQDGAGCEQHE